MPVGDSDTVCDLPDDMVDAIRFSGTSHSPLSFRPHATTLPSVPITTTWLIPHVIAIPSEIGGIMSIPYSFHPQITTSPLRLIAAEK